MTKFDECLSGFSVAGQLHFSVVLTHENHASSQNDRHLVLSIMPNGGVTMQLFARLEPVGPRPVCSCSWPPEQSTPGNTVG